jgi:Periplasmic binding protein
MLPEALEAGGQNQRPDLDPLVISIEAKLQRAGKGKRLVIENGAGDEVNAGLAAMISEAFSIRNQLLSGSDDSVEAMTERLEIGKGRAASTRPWPENIVLFSGPASADLTGRNCSPYAVGWTYDTYALAHGTANAIVRSGGDSWFFITADYAFGYAMQRDASNVINSDGGIVLGSVMVPLGMPDFSSYLLQAKNVSRKGCGTRPPVFLCSYRPPRTRRL